MLNIQPSPWTASLAGLFAAVAWPHLWSRWGGAAVDGGMELIAATLLVIALPAHVFVIGLNASRDSAAARTLDTALPKRVGAWVAAAAGVTLFRSVTGL